MILEHYPVEKLKDNILNIMERHLDLGQYELFFFGSRVRGDNFERADIDIGISGEGKLDSSLKFKIKEDLNELIPILYKIDFVDFASASDNFKKQALKYKESII